MVFRAGIVLALNDLRCFAQFSSKVKISEGKRSRLFGRFVSWVRGGCSQKRDRPADSSPSECEIKADDLELPHVFLRGRNDRRQEVQDGQDEEEDHDSKLSCLIGGSKRFISYQSDSQFSLFLDIAVSLYRKASADAHLPNLRFAR